MATATKTTQPSDAQILAKLRRAQKGKTAAELGTTAKRLREIESVVEVGHQQTGKRGRPAIVFGVNDA